MMYKELSPLDLQLYKNMFFNTKMSLKKNFRFQIMFHHKKYL